VAVNAFMLLSSRTLIGLAVGADSALATAYIVEFAPARRRGSLAILQQWMITVGILVSYLVALLTFKIAPQAAGGADWRIILGLGAVPALVAIALRSRMPESPRWLLHKGRLEDARHALGQLGVYASAEHVHDTAAQIADADEDRQHASPWTRGVRRALVVVCVFFVFQQITGINVPFYYGPQLLGQLFQGGSNPVDAAVAGIAAAAVLGAVNVVATFFAFRYIDRVGRRKLAIGGYAGMAVFILITAAGVAFLMGPAQVVVVIVGFSFFITSFAIGVGGTGWLIQGEVFPTAIRGRAACIGAAVDWVANFAIILLFPALTTAFGLPVLMVLLAVLAVLAIGFVARFLPETKNLTLDEVTQTFEKQAATTH
jgi:MFS transporter, SP family, arabinose:H+ symporter